MLHMLLSNLHIIYESHWRTVTNIHFKTDFELIGNVSKVCNIQ